MFYVTHVNSATVNPVNLSPKISTVDYPLLNGLQEADEADVSLFLPYCYCLQWFFTIYQTDNCRNKFLLK